MEIKASKLFFSYPGREVLMNIDLSINRGDFMGITGSTGSGKTTLAYCLNGLIPHAIMGDFRGSVEVCGLDTRKHKVAEIARKVGMVFQDPDWQLFSLSVREEIEFGLRNLKMGNIEKRVRDAVAMVGLEGYEDTEPYNLSQGQKQKLCIASVLAMDPDVVILDEPTSQLDYRSTTKIYGILDKMNRDGKTVIVIEHNTDLLVQHSNRVVLLDEGRIVKGGPTKEVLRDRKTLQRLGIRVPGRSGK
jgi:energy-coupling factor transporter ATP-binding protein EcfA2